MFEPITNHTFIIGALVTLFGISMKLISYPIGWDVMFFIPVSYLIIIFGIVLVIHGIKSGNIIQEQPNGMSGNHG